MYDMPGKPHARFCTLKYIAKLLLRCSLLHRRVLALAFDPTAFAAARLRSRELEQLELSSVCARCECLCKLITHHIIRAVRTRSHGARE